MANNDLIIDRNAEGAWRICALVTDGISSPWFYTERFYYYSRRESIEHYRAHLADLGYKVVDE